MWEAYQNWSRGDLIRELRRLEIERRELCEQVKELRQTIGELKFKIETELNPRIAAERRSYDRWVVSRGMGDDI